MTDGEHIYGDGVNLAARIEPFAEPGGICISDFIYKQVSNKINLIFKDLGEKSVKNISEPVRIYHLTDASATSASTIEQFTQGAAAPLTLPDKPSLAVLPFVNLSNDSEQEYFCSGLTMDIMTALVKISGLFLISESSMYTYNSKPVTISELGTQLGVVGYALESGVRKAENQVRVTSQLIEVSNGRRVWAERFDRQMDNLFAVQDEIIAVSKEILKGNPDNIEALLVLAGASIVLERIKEAQRAIQDLLRIKPAYTIEEFARSHPYKDQQTMDTMVARLKEAGLS